MINGINKGDNTNHHDQFIKCVNFNPINRMVNKPIKPIPFVLALFDIFVNHYERNY